MPMSGLQLALIGLAVLIGLLVIRIPVGLAMLAVGICGYVALSGFDPVLAYMKTAAFWQFASYEFSVIPMFLLMGEFASRSGLSRSLFSAANVFLGHRRARMNDTATPQAQIDVLIGDIVALNGTSP